MDKKIKSILGSITVIAIVASLMTVGTQSFFSDIETSTGNTFTAGIIDLTVNGENPLESAVVTIDDMKPCSVFYIEKKLHISGNPADVWLHIKDIVCGQGVQTEPEIEEELQMAGGVANDAGKYDIDNYITYDLKVGWDKNGDGEITKDEYEIIFYPDDHIKFGWLECIWIPLGYEMPPDVDIIVNQSFHMQAEVTNWAQGDTCTFTEEFFANQITAPDPANVLLILENKDDNWNPIYGDGVWGLLAYNPAGSTFDYQFMARGLQPNTGYSLIYFADPWPGNHPGALIAAFTSDASGMIALTAGSTDLNMDLPDPSDANYPTGAKIWLVLSSDYDIMTYAMTAFQMSKYLFEHNLITYDDTDV